MEKANWENIDFQNRPQPVKVKDSPPPMVCAGRTYTWEKLAFQGLQISTVAALAYAYFASMFYPHTNKIVRDVCLAGIVTIISVSTVRELIYCSKRFRPKTEGILNPFVLLAVATIGAALATQAAYSLSKTAVHDYQEELSAKEKAFNQSLITCNNDVINQADTFTNPPCVPCHYIEEGYDLPLNETVLQEVIKNIDAVVCQSPANQAYWPYLVNVNLNQTNGTWPCMPELVNVNQTWTNNNTYAYNTLFNVIPPLVFNAFAVNSTCKRLTGFGTQVFVLSELCGLFLNDPDDIGNYDFDMLQCITPAFESYMQAYVEKIREDQTFSSEEPTIDAYNTIWAAPVIEMWISIPLSIITATGYEWIQRVLKNKFRQRRLLTN